MRQFPIKIISNRKKTSKTPQPIISVHISPSLAPNNPLQNSISEESRAAYNSLVEKPAQSLRRFNYEIASLEEIRNLKDHLHLSASTSALQSPPKTDATDESPAQDDKIQSPSAQTASGKRSKQSELFVPTQQAPRPTTLPYRNSMGKLGRVNIAEIDSNPLRILRDKNYPIVRPRMRVNTSVDTSEFTSTGENHHSDKDSVCESPSYLTNPEYTFTERDVNIHRGDTQKHCGSKEIENLNPIPLPPRDRNKVLLTNVKRHVRKHPLIIPASGLQRTLNKVKTPVEEKNAPTFPGVAIDEIDCGLKSPSYENNYNMPRTATKPAEVTKLQPLDDHSYMNQEDIHVGSVEDRPSFRRHTNSTSSNDFNPDFRTYENLDTLRLHLENTDSASLHFESILESDINPVGDRTSPDGVNGFLFDNYDVPRVNSRLSTNDNDANRSSTSFEYRNADIERRRLEFAQKYPNYVQPRNELASNALFNKYREPTDRNENPSIALRDAATIGDGINNNNPIQSIDLDTLEDVNEEDDKILERKLKDTNSVSCEDLLEFSDKKPKGKERGIESDEVRIMTKVLGTVVSKVFFLNYTKTPLTISQRIYSSKCFFFSINSRPRPINVSSLWISSNGMFIRPSN